MSSYPRLTLIIAVAALLLPAITQAQTTSIKEVWSDQFTQNQIPVTVFETEDMRVFAFPTPIGAKASLKKGTPITFIAPDTDDGIENACVVLDGQSICHDNMLSDLHNDYVSELQINRVLDSPDPEITILELSNLRLIAFYNHNKVFLSQGDPVSLYDDAQGRVYLCITGEHTICADEVSLNEDSPFVPMENQIYTL